MAQKMPIKLQELCAASLTHPLPSHRTRSMSRLPRAASQALVRWHPQPPSLTRSPHTAHAAVSPVPSFHQALPLCVGSAKLGAAGIKPEDLNFKSVTMDSGAFICIRETAAQSVAIIDTANPTNTQRMPAPVELSCVVARLLLCRCCRRAKLECPALTRCCLLVGLAAACTPRANCWSCTPPAPCRSTRLNPRRRRQTPCCRRRPSSSSGSRTRRWAS